MILDLSGKVAIVTGSGRGIGRSVAIRLAKEGVKVMVNAKKGVEEAKETLELIEKTGGEGEISIADVSTREGCRKLKEDTIKKFGKIDILINNAGLGLYSYFIEADDKMIEKQLDVTLKSVIFCSQEIGKELDKEGSIINISSIAGLIPARGLSIYGAAKAGIISLTRSMAVELSPVRVNAIAPGVVKTKMGDSLLNIYKRSEEDFSKEKTLLGRIVEPDEIAEIIATILKIPTITGQVIVIDSGESLLGIL
ncbi:SDR family oxidoreductase [Acidianus brierleyi]|uniref:Short chain dehydrogenase n=1 Tax=Acidianus brierleyi TaxID=41673 RepID=A0A2U9IHW9_9CREN|nr:SDR family oxidoreductase [Acidianus brierleyi]AWR95610.1 SDR family oxidoreductase [Acidianus brierleyi]